MARSAGMSLKKAVETLTPLTDGETTPLTYSGTEATKLGIEALKEVSALRNVLKGLGGSLLPGETEE